MPNSQCWHYDPLMNQIQGKDDGNCDVLRAVPYGGTPEEVLENGYRIAAVNELYEVAQKVLICTFGITGLHKMAREAIQKADGKV